MFEPAVKNLDDVLWKEVECSSELDYTQKTRERPVAPRDLNGSQFDENNTQKTRERPVAPRDLNGSQFDENNRPYSTPSSPHK